MNYDQFIRKIKDLGIEVNEKTTIYDIDKRMFSGDITRDSNKMRKGIKPRFDFILQYWSTGGLNAATSLNDYKPQCYVSDRPIPKSFERLDELLENFYPNISYLNYKKLEKLVKIGRATEYGKYSGGRTDYNFRYINLKEFYNVLVENCGLEDIK